MNHIDKLLPQEWHNYADWLMKQNNPPKSYLAHPFNSEIELKECKKAFQKFVGMSLGKYIRLKRISYLLKSNNKKYAEKLFIDEINTPLGKMIAVFSEKGLCLLEFLDRKSLETELLSLQKTFKANFVWQSSEKSRLLQMELEEYFKRNLITFSTILDPIGTEFQKEVWSALIKIPYGKTKSYKQQAEYLNKSNAIRAIASANGKNKISILVPCHRVIGSDGSLVGYGGGIERKKALLQLENAI